MTYHQALELLFSTKAYSAKPDLSRIRQLLYEMGEPQKKLKFVHVTGTNGKGSTVAMVSSVLTHAGFKTGAFQSPHLERFNERLSINGQNITDAALIRLICDMQPYLNALIAGGHAHTTFFETLTAMAFKYWADNDCEIVVLEVGMGGETDATNIIDTPLIAMITAMSLDHVRVLGPAISDIARQKCGIIKRGCTFIDYALQDPSAKSVIKSACANLAVPYITPDPSALSIAHSGLNGTNFTYKGLCVSVPLSGAHQPYNAIGAIEALWALRGMGYAITDAQIIQGIANTRMPGRLEILRETPLCIIDAAHNVAAIQRLCQAVDAFMPKPIIAVMGMLKDKDYAPCIAQIAKRAAAFIATTPDSPRALCPGQTAQIAKEYTQTLQRENIESAVDEGLRLAAQMGATLLICGSLHVIGRARTHLTQ